MIVFLTQPQVMIVVAAKSYLSNTLGNDKVATMFREEGQDMSVGLAYSEQGQHFIARETIPAMSTVNSVKEACDRLIVNLAVSYFKVMNRQAKWGG